MNVQASVVIDRPIDQVFDYTNNHVVEWSRTVVEDTVLQSHNDGGVGTTFRCVTVEKGQRMEFLGTVIEWDPPKRSSVLLQGQHFDIGAEYLFEAIDYQKTRVTQKSTIEGKGIVKLVFFLFGRMLNKAGCDAHATELNNLKKMLESKPVQVVN